MDSGPSMNATDEYEVLSHRLRDRGFTPGLRDVPELLNRWRKIVAGAPRSVQRRITKLMVQALGRADRPVALLLLRELGQADADQRALTIRALSRIADRMDLSDWEQALAAALADPDTRVVRAALRATGKLDEGNGARYERAAVEHLERAALPEQRAAAEALGKLGGHAALTALRALQPDDPELARRCAEAIALIERRQLRGESTEILTAVPLPQATPVVLRCRPGTARFAKEQACALLGLSNQDLKVGPLGVNLIWTGSLAQLHCVRIAIDAALAFELTPGTDLAQRIANTLARPALAASLAAWSEGPLRFRLSFLDGSPRRAVVRAVAASLNERELPLHNDSREAPWSIQVDLEGARLLCVPRDPGLRFSYSRVQVPAASHPTLAALMAWVARPRPAETVWDPFCGSASELIECARLEPSVRLYGTDQSATAIAAASKNLKAAGLAIEPGALVQADALTTQPQGAHAPVRPSLIITNPPMGRRAMSGYGVHELLRRFVARAAALLPRDGRLVWVTPAAKVSAAAGRDAGLQVIDHGAIDLAGLRVNLQVMVR